MSLNRYMKSRVYGRISASTPRKVWGVGDFLDFGPRDAVSKALQRLAKAGNIRRIEPGLYDRPTSSRLTGQKSPPDYREVITAISRQDQARILIDGMTAANDLGLSDAVPGRVVVHTDKRREPLQLGNLTIQFKLTSARKLIWAGRPAMRIVQALHWLKPKLDKPEEHQQISKQIHGMLMGRQGAVLRKDLSLGFATLPTWMQTFLRDFLPDVDKRVRKASGKRAGKHANTEDK